MTSINTNYGALVALQQLSQTQEQLQVTQTRLSTGLNINSPKDDGAIFAIAQGARSQLAGFGVVSQSLSRAISVVDVAIASGEAVYDILLELKETALAASDDSLSSEQRSALNEKFTSLRDQIGTIVETGEFNGVNLINGSRTSGISALANQDGSRQIHIAAEDFRLSGFAPPPSVSPPSSNGENLGGVANKDTRTSKNQLSPAPKPSVSPPSSSSSSKAENLAGVATKNTYTSKEQLSPAPTPSASSPTSSTPVVESRSVISAAPVGASKISAAPVGAGKISAAPVGVSKSVADASRSVISAAQAGVADASKSVADASRSVILAAQAGVADASRSLADVGASKSVADASRSVISAAQAGVADASRSLADVGASKSVADASRSVISAAQAGVADASKSVADASRSVISAAPAGASRSLADVGASKISAAPAGASRSLADVGASKISAAPAGASKSLADVGASKISATPAGASKNLADVGASKNVAGASKSVASTSATDAGGTGVSQQIYRNSESIATNVSSSGQSGSQGQTITLSASAGVATAAEAKSSLATIETSLKNLSRALGRLGTGAKVLDSQYSLVSRLSDTLEAGIGRLVDADIGRESARLQALQVKHEIGIRVLSVANAAPAATLSLFAPSSSRDGHFF